MELFKALTALMLMALLIVSAPLLSEPVRDIEEGLFSLVHENEGSYIPVNLTVPAIPSTSPYVPDSKPRSSSSIPPGFEISSRYQYTNFYSNTTGTLEMAFINEGEEDLFIYGYNVKLPGSKIIKQDASCLIHPGEEEKMRLLSIPVPAESDMIDLQTEVDMLVHTGSDSWYDYNTQIFEEISIPITPYPSTHEPESSYAPKPLFELTNTKVVSRDENVRAMAARAVTDYPGKYNIYQVCAIFDNVKNEVKYISDPRGEDYWTGPDETLKVMAGDCEDHAILLCSLTESIGGTTRMYLTDDHAFATVFIGKQPADIVEAIREYYGSVPVYYLRDEYGCWLILDPTAGLYAGDLAAGMVPSNNGFAFVNTTSLTIVDIESGFEISGE